MGNVSCFVFKMGRSMKAFICCIVCMVTVLICCTIGYLIISDDNNRIEEPILKTIKIVQLKQPNLENMKYVLIWTKPGVVPIKELRKGQETFIQRQCPINTCFVTSNRNYFPAITEFDAIIFHGPEIVNKLPKMPSTRSIHQKYIFASIESSDNYPVCDLRFEGFFNWTWTYKLNSDVNNAYLKIKNKEGEIIGPKQQMDWLKVEDMDHASNEIVNKLSNKTKLAAWFVSNCNAPSGRDEFVNEVQKYLNEYDLSVDIYGKCGTKICSHDDESICLNLIERDYYFYFSFENSFSEDYVTEKLLLALKNYAIPVVYGAANYSRFMPDGIYLNGRSLGAKELTRQMMEIHKDKKKYLSYFKWHNHYSYHDVFESYEGNSICDLCAMINNQKLMTEYTAYEDFKSWWNPQGKC